MSDMRWTGALFLAISAISAGGAEGAWFLHLQRAGEEFQLKGALRSSANIKALSAGQAHDFEYQVLSAEGEVLASGGIDLRHEQRLEAPAPGGELAHVEHEANDFTLRVPMIEGGARFRILDRPGRQAEGEAGTIAAEFDLPQNTRARAAEAGALEVLFETGPRINRINLVVFGDGFREEEIESFRNHAAEAVEKFLSTPPIAAYRSFFNAYTIFTPSSESGSDHPAQGIYRDTYFNSSYDSYGIYYLLTIPPNNHDPLYENGRGKVYELLAEHLPEYDIPLMIVNDREYGGSGGPVPVASVEGRAAEIMVHELGHSFAGLGDEYTSPYPGYPEIEEPNTTRETQRGLIKWNAWIEPTTPVPTPPISSYAEVVGLFEGAHYHTTGWYRPKLDCKMKTLGIPFCEVCAETLTLEMHERVSMLQETLPEETELVAGSSDIEFRAELLQASSGGVALEWSVGGVVQTETGELFRLNAGTLEPGSHEVKLRARDHTDLVRTDPQGLLEEIRVWNLTISAVAELRLIPRNLTGNTFSFEVNRSVAGGVLEKSIDLQTWVPVATNSFEAGVSIQVPANPGEQTGYVRIVE